MSEHKPNKKTRNQSLFEYFESLQLEYVQAELRKKIYITRKHRNFQEKLMGRKKVKIEDIAQRNNLPSIFNNRDEYERFYNRIYNADRYPDFVYANEEQREEFQVRDFESYYNPSSEVKVMEDEVRIGVIKQLPVDGMVLVEIRGESEPRLVKGELVVRIL